MKKLFSILVALFGLFILAGCGDETLPVIEVNPDGLSTILYVQDCSTTEHKATASDFINYFKVTDDTDGEITITPGMLFIMLNDETVREGINLCTTGTYEIKLAASDLAGNNASSSITVEVVLDVEMNPDSLSTSFEQGSNNAQDRGIDWEDYITYNNINCIADDSTVDFTTVGIYQVEYTCTYNNDETETFALDVEITEAPIPMFLTSPENGSYITESQTVTFDDIYSATYTLNGVEMGEYTSGTSLTEEGVYVVTLKNISDNTNSIEFTIDRTAPVFDYQGNKNTVNYFEINSWSASIPEHHDVLDPNGISHNVVYTADTCTGEVITLEQAREYLTNFNTVCVEYILTDTAGNTSSHSITYSSLFDLESSLEYYSNYDLDLKKYMLDVLADPYCYDVLVSTGNTIENCLVSAGVEIFSYLSGDVVAIFDALNTDFANVLTVVEQVDKFYMFNSSVTSSVAIVSVTQTTNGHIFNINYGEVVVSLELSISTYNITGTIYLEDSYTEYSTTHNTELFIYFNVTKNKFTVMFNNLTHRDYSSSDDYFDETALLEFSILENGYKSFVGNFFEEHEYYGTTQTCYDEECTDYYSLIEGRNETYQLYGYGNSENTTFQGVYIDEFYGNYNNGIYTVTFADYFYNQNTRYVGDAYGYYEEVDGEIMYLDFLFLDLQGLSGYDTIFEYCEPYYCWYDLYDENGYSILGPYNASNSGYAEIYYMEEIANPGLIFTIGYEGYDEVSITLPLSDYFENLNYDLSYEEFEAYVALGYDTVSYIYSDETLTTFESADDIYNYLNIDSDYSIVLDIPQFTSDQENTGYSESQTVTYDESLYDAYYTFNNGKLQMLSSGTTFTEEGNYTIVLVSSTGKFNVISFNIDTTAPYFVDAPSEYNISSTDLSNYSLTLELPIFADDLDNNPALTAVYYCVNDYSTNSTEHLHSSFITNCNSSYVIYTITDSAGNQATMTIDINYELVEDFSEYEDKYNSFNFDNASNVPYVFQDRCQDITLIDDSTTTNCNLTPELSALYDYIDIYNLYISDIEIFWNAIISVDNVVYEQENTLTIEEYEDITITYYLESNGHTIYVTYADTTYTFSTYFNSTNLQVQITDGTISYNFTVSSDSNYGLNMSMSGNNMNANINMYNDYLYFYYRDYNNNVYISMEGFTSLDHFYLYGTTSYSEEEFTQDTNFTTLLYSDGRVISYYTTTIYMIDMTLFIESFILDIYNISGYDQLDSEYFYSNSNPICLDDDCESYLISDENSIMFNIDILLEDSNWTYYFDISEYFSELSYIMSAEEIQNIILYYS